MPSPTGRVREVLSAGAVVLGPGGTVLLVHRPKYDDWSFPKGKLDRGEHATAAAVREVEEETGLRVRLGSRWAASATRSEVGMKTVHYWVGRAVGDGDVGGYEPNAEIDEVAWFPIDKARRRLTYALDIDTLDEALEHAQKTRTLVVLRHGQARSRKAWRGDDRVRPLLATGKHQADRLVPVLSAYDVRRLVSSSSTRCVQTLEPYAAATGRRLRTEDRLSEEDASPKAVRAVLGAADGPALRAAGLGGRPGRLHPPAGAAVGLRRPRARGPRARDRRAARPAPAQGPDPGGRAAPRRLNRRPEPSPRRRSRDRRLTPARPP